MSEGFTLPSRSPTQRTLARLRRDGWRPAVVERWNPHVRRRQDLYGFVDVLAFRPDWKLKTRSIGLVPVLVAAGETIAVQATTATNVSHRAAKIMDTQKLGDLVVEMLAAGWRVEVWGWKGAQLHRRLMARLIGWRDDVRWYWFEEPRRKPQKAPRKPRGRPAAPRGA